MTDAPIQTSISDDLSKTSGIPHQNSQQVWIEIGVAVAAFIAFCVAILLKNNQLLEPDDYAYRASIVALSQGHLALTTTQYHALSAQVGGIQQWVQLPNGIWISEKNPGYPFYAVIFDWLHALRFAPLFAGGFASVSLFIAARKWLGKWAGMYAVLFFLASGMAMAFAYRATMPTFTDASFVAAGAGAVLWAMISLDASDKRRTIIGLLGFFCIEIAVSMRYTDVVMLIVAVAAILIGYKPAKLRRSLVAMWMGSVLLFGGAILLFDELVYGSPTKTGYANGEITFSLGAIWPNLHHMPNLLVRSVPALILAFAALAWIAVRLIRSRLRSVNQNFADAARRDGLVALFLAAGWLGLWSLYLAYNWTAQMGGGVMPGIGKMYPGMNPSGGALPSGLKLPSGVKLPALHSGIHIGAMHLNGAGGGIHLIRFYAPAIGLIALLATWFVMQLPRWIAPLLAVAAVVTAYGSFDTLIAGGGMPGGGIPGASGNLVPGGQPIPGGLTPPSGNKAYLPMPPGGYRPPNGQLGPPGSGAGSTTPGGTLPGR